MCKLMGEQQTNPKTGNQRLSFNLARKLNCCVIVNLTLVNDDDTIYNNNTHCWCWILTAIGIVHV